MTASSGSEFSGTAIRGLIKEELAEIRKKHANARRTKIGADEGDFDIEDLIAEEDVIITVSRAGYVKRLPVDSFPPTMQVLPMQPDSGGWIAMTAQNLLANQAIAANVSPPPARLYAGDAAIARAIVSVPCAKASNSNTPTGPFQTIVPADFRMSASDAALVRSPVTSSTAFC